MASKKNDHLATIQTYYPNAVAWDDTMKTVADYVQNTLKMEPSQVMLADSICSDDINAIQYAAHKFLGPFKLGGLDGFPFTGLTGMGAFAHHIPDKGVALVYYGPHIGISKDGRVGSVHRHGRALISGACGAAQGALGKLKDKPEKLGKLDYQMDTIVRILSKKKDDIEAAKQPLIEATDVMYKAIDKRIQKLVAETKFGDCQYLILVGVVLINSDAGSFNDVRRFDVIDLTTKETEQLA